MKSNIKISKPQAEAFPNFVIFKIDNAKVVCRNIRHTTQHGAVLQAKLKAEAEYEKYRVEQDGKYLSDFDKLLIETRKNP